MKIIRLFAASILLFGSSCFAENKIAAIMSSLIKTQRLTILALIPFILLVVGCQSTDDSLTLSNKEIEFSVETTTSETLPTNAMHTSGIIIEKFNQSKFYSDASDFNAGSFGGNYTYQALNAKPNLNPTKYVLKKTTYIPELSSNRSLKLNTKLNFESDTSGSFSSEFIDQEKILLKQTGNFKIKNITFNALPKTLIHHKITLSIDEINDESSGLKKGSKIAMAFEEGIINFSSTGFSVNSSNFKILNKDSVTQSLTGKTDDDRYSFAIDLNYETFTAGNFSITLNGKKDAGRGGFWTMQYTPAVSIDRKGRFIADIISSKITQIDYKYFVYLPPNYDSSNKKYSVIYATDGQWCKDFANYIELKHKEIIFVAIEEGPENRRLVDYGVEKGNDYIQFLKKEFIPLIESKYRASSDRTFYGSSLGGTLGAMLIIDEPIEHPYFHNYIIADGAFWALTPALMKKEEDRMSKTPLLNINLFLASTRKGNGRATEIYIDHLNKLHWSGLNIQLKEFNQLTHEEISGPTFDAYIDQIN